MKACSMLWDMCSGDTASHVSANFFCSATINS
jgi:hypothetical protein